ncbi:electron transfer flavoprotein subunit beta/FixA family protein [Devosia lacusdianchii]|uniref:electron transfer flavoprotein subunit beta/FixA family protein n=1 Tax=Devosia lacusdianchii TaxID=2917991 RepID=UPI001F0600B4|nr:electron transfer flavoprotein subunit beta/FixA family protein [Devosia sp. JXJ CY 41]
MKILVPVKRVVDFNVRIRVKPDGSGVDLNNVKMAMNPFDEIALEEAVRLVEAGTATEVIAVTIGPAVAQDVLRTALAMGATRAILVTTDIAPEPLAVAKILTRVARDESVDLVLLGKQAIDDDANQTGQMLAALLDWPQATFASEVTVAGEAIRVTREVDGGTQTLELTLPAVVSADLRLNQPRFVSLPNILKARSKPLSQIDSATLGLDLAPRLKVQRTEEPPARKAGATLASVDELIDRLRAQAIL